MRPHRDASYASNRLTRNARLSGGHLLSNFNKPESKDNKLHDPPKLETPRNVREPSIDAEPLSTTDAESSDSDTPQRPKDNTKRQILGEKLAAGTNNGSSLPCSTHSSANRNTSTRKPLGRTSSVMTADDDDDNPYFSLSSQTSYKRARQTGYGSKSKSTSFSSMPSSSARSIVTPGRTPQKSKADSAQSSTKKSKSKSNKGDSSSESEPEVGFKVPIHVHAPSPKKSKSSTEVKKKAPSPQFKMPPAIQTDLFPASSLGASSRDVQLNAGDLSSDSSLSTPLSSPSSSIMDAMQRETGFESGADRRSPSPPRKALCPMCNAEVDPEILRQFQAQPKQRLREQQRFCASHKQDTATKEWEAQGYPDINWDTFEHRLEGYFPDMDKYLDPEEPSYYRNILESAQKAGKNLRLTLDGDGIEVISCGYYGTKGAQKMLYAVMERFGVRLRRLAKDDPLVAKMGVVGYAQSVIVPELATRLIGEDMDVHASAAREIMRQSIEIGQKLNPQLDDVVPVDEDDY
ncbi:hypothetical protein N7504_007756 [Penicillium tannophilum]|nr:hypothetical protein N7504_007756 [Penicillium tannophilum]